MSGFREWGLSEGRRIEGAQPRPYGGIEPGRTEVPKAT
jgi:hypothetical protein